MARKRSQTLTDGELRIMDVIWNLEEASVREVTDRLNQDEVVAYNTVQTMMGILETKGYLAHHKQGRAFVYRPLVDRDRAQRKALKHLLSQFFAGSPAALVQNLLDNDEVDPMEIDRLRAMIDESTRDSGEPES
ncbi:MAG: BlaI/MecI/CopY family transcriptional regulator [Xanthomonadales bacterium]|nr:BlaI/MecI/CopY family transcriptional regulator [Xanthomonadales bacterium]